MSKTPWARAVHDSDDGEFGMDELPHTTLAVKHITSDAADGTHETGVK